MLLQIEKMNVLARSVDDRDTVFVHERDNGKIVISRRAFAALRAMKY